MTPLSGGDALAGTGPIDPSHRYALQTAVIGARLLDWQPGLTQRT